MGSNRSDFAQEKPGSAGKFQGGYLKAKITFENKYLKAKNIFESKKLLLWGKTQSKQATASEARWPMLAKTRLRGKLGRLFVCF